MLPCSCCSLSFIGTVLLNSQEVVFVFFFVTGARPSILAEMLQFKATAVAGELRSHAHTALSMEMLLVFVIPLNLQ